MNDKEFMAYLRDYRRFCNKELKTIDKKSSMYGFYQKKKEFLNEVLRRVVCD